MLVSFMFYTCWMRYDLPDDLWIIETCMRCNVSTIKLHIDIEYLVGYNTVVYQIMHGMNGGGGDDDDE